MKTLKKAYMTRHYINKDDDDYFLDRISVPINDVLVDYTEITIKIERMMKKEAGLKMKDVIFKISHDEEDSEYINIDVMINAREKEKAISDIKVFYNSILFYIQCYFISNNIEVI